MQAQIIMLKVNNTNRTRERFVLVGLTATSITEIVQRAGEKYKNESG